MFRRTYSLATADLVDADAIKQSVASSATAVNYSGAALDGVAMDGSTFKPRPAGHALPVYPSVTTGSSVGSYVVGSKWVFTGMYNGQVVQRTAELTDADGNETVVADGPLEDGTISSVSGEAQTDANGTVQLGYSGIGAKSLGGKGYSPYPNSLAPWRRLQANAAGNVLLGYIGGGEDTVPMIDGAVLDVEFIRVKATSVDLTLFEE